MLFSRTRTHLWCRCLAIRAATVRRYRDRWAGAAPCGRQRQCTRLSSHLLTTLVFPFCLLTSETCTSSVRNVLSIDVLMVTHQWRGRGTGRPRSSRRLSRASSSRHAARDVTTARPTELSNTAHLCIGRRSDQTRRYVCGSHNVVMCST